RIETKLLGRAESAHSLADAKARGNDIAARFLELGDRAHEVLLVRLVSGLGRILEAKFTGLVARALKHFEAEVRRNVHRADFLRIPLLREVTDGGEQLVVV